MTPEETAAAAADPINALGGRFMMYRPTFRRGTEAGFPKGWYLYTTGRGGVLGDVDADVVAAAFGYFPRDWLRETWAVARGVMPPAEAAELYAECCRQWGRDHLAEVEGLDRLVSLLQRVVAAADVAGAPLFAGWRALPLPDDAPGAVAQLMMVLREHRGGQHLLTVLSEGLLPLEAVVAGGGEGNAEFFSWPPPYPDREPLRERFAAAEARTNVLAARAWAALSPEEGEKAVALLDRVRAAVDG